jgi:hypothetical protein
MTAGNGLCKQSDTHGSDNPTPRAAPAVQAVVVLDGVVLHVLALRAGVVITPRGVSDRLP